jgi:hypothetical protein
VHKKAFSFELNENVEPSKFVVALMELHAQFKDQKNQVHPEKIEGEGIANNAKEISIDA